MEKAKFTAALLAAIMTASALTSCSDNTSENTADTTANNTSAETTASDGYNYSGHDFDGYTFRVLSLEQNDGCYVRLDFEEQTGETLDDAVYDRNRFVEEQLNFTFKEIIQTDKTNWTAWNTGICEKVVTAVLSGDDIYDAAYAPPYFMPEIMTGGYLINLLEIPELNVTADHWDTVINNELTINNSLYTASGPFNLMSFDLSWCLLFNEDMLADLNLDSPYDLVRSGKWTLDRLGEYAESAANLNGSDSFTYTENCEIVYGMSGHASCTEGFLYSGGYRYYKINGSGEIELKLEDERVYSIMDKLSRVCSISDGKVYYKDYGVSYQPVYLDLFRKGQALFVMGELKAALEMREMEDTIGLLPLPKYDEQQEEYYTLTNSVTPLLVIPKTQTDTARAGVILDALTYESSKRILPIYYDVTVSQKGLRNEDSIEMMQIIRETRGIDFTGLYKINSSIATELRKMIEKGSGSTGTASTIAANASAVEAALEALLDAMKAN